MKNFNANYLQAITRLNASPRAYVEIETDLGYSIFLTTHSSIDIIRDRYVFNFNGDGYIETNNRVLSGDFNIKFSLKIDSSSTSDLKLLDSNNSTDRLDVNYSSIGQSINLRGYFTVYVDGVQTNSLPKDDEFHAVELVRDSSNTDQSTRQVGKIGARYTNSFHLKGSMKDIAIYSDDELVLSMPINDNSNTIKDYAGVDDGVLTAGTGTWEVQNLKVTDHVINGVISGLQTSSEDVTPEKGFSVLGGGSISLNEAGLTEELRSLLANNETIFNKKVSIYSGEELLDINDYEKVQTLYVKDIGNNDVSYSIPLTTAQIFSNKKLFETKSTELFTSFNADDAITEIEVLSTDGLELVAHDAEWEDSPNEKVGYLNFVGQDADGNEVFEIVKYWSSDATKFYGDPNNSGKIERSVFNTGRVTATGTSDSDTATEIREHIYIDLACGKMIIALLTGDLYGQVGETLPYGWHAGVDPSLVNLTSIEDIGFDLWNPADDIGFHSYIDQPDETTAKSYIAREILRVVSLVFITDVNGEIAAKRYGQIIPESGPVVVLDDNDISNKPNFNRQSQNVRNQFPTKWDYRAREQRFIRSELIIDQDSVDRNNITSRAETIELKAIRNNSSEVNDLLRTVTDGIRTRLTNPYIKPSIQTSFRRAVNLECMDVIGLDLVGFADYADSGDINRSFEIQQIKHDWINRTVSMQIFGSTDPASPINIESTSQTPVIDHTGWLKVEDYLSGTFTDTGSVLTLTSNSTLGALGDYTTKKYYYDGLIDLNGFGLIFSGTKVIDAAFDATNSSISAVAGGGVGGLGQTTTSITSSLKGDTGYFGSYDSAEEGVYLSPTNGGPNSNKNRSIRPASITTQNGVSYIENLVLNIDEGGVLTGLPDRFNGRSGSGGLRAYSTTAGGQSNGGNGANGGGGLIILANEFIYNNSTIIDLSASQTPVAPTSIVNINSDGFTGFEVAGGRGGSAYGGCLAIIIKDRSKPLVSNVDGIFRSKTTPISTWAGSITRPLETTSSTTKNTDTAVLVPFRNSSAENRVNGVDYANSAFLSKFIGGAVVNTPVVGRDPIGLVPAPTNLTLTESIDTPSTQLGNISTVTANVTPPSDTNYSHTIFSYKGDNFEAFYPFKYSIPDEATFTATSNGGAYEVKAQSVSKQGVLGGAITSSITLKNVLTEPAIELEVQLPRVTGLQLKNRIAPNNLSEFKSGNAEFTWNATSNSHSVSFGNEGLLGASSGSYDSYANGYQVTIFDSNNNYVRDEFTSTESYIYTYDKNKADNGTAIRSFYIQVLTRGNNNQFGEGIKFKVNNPQPEAVTGLNPSSSYNSIQVDFISPNDVDFIGVNMRFRKVGILTWSLPLFIAGTSCTVPKLDSGEEYEIELTSVDQFGVGASTSTITSTTKIDAIEIDDITTPLTLDENGGVIVTNNADFQSITGVTDGTWNQLPNPTIYAAVNTGTDTQTFGVDVLGNAIIGADDNAVSFINGLIEFGSNVTIGSNLNQTVTVGSGGDYATINLALEQLSKIVPAYKSGGFTATINILSGTTISEQILINGVNLSFISITSDDLIVQVDGSSFTGVNAFVYVDSGGVSPLIATTFNLSAGTSINGAVAQGGGSFISFSSDNKAGMTGFEANLFAEFGGSIFATNCTLDDGGIAIKSHYGSNIDASNSTAKNSTSRAIEVLTSKVDFFLGDASGSNQMFAVTEGSKLNALYSNFSNWNTNATSSVGVVSASSSASLNYANFKSSTNVAGRNTLDIFSSTTDVDLAEFEIGTGTKALMDIQGSTLGITFSSHFDITASNGAIIRAASSISYNTNLVGQAVTVNGILFE